MSEEFLILNFSTAKEAADFAKVLGLSSDFCLTLYNIASYEGWLFVKGICDICNYEQAFFIPACTYEEEIIGSECGNCENMSVYPKEGNWEDEGDNNVDV